ncbi:acyltransferase [Sediminibacterium sp.]|uniref:acyltransferase n=1 Tax=Sediminibacterium sp. TaxID=1917865 RepID=UPI003F72BFB6
MRLFLKKIIGIVASVLIFEIKFLGRFLFRIIELIGQIFPEDSRGCKIRGLIYRPFLKKCGKNFQVGMNAKLEHLSEIEVGNDVYIGHGCWISGIRGGIILEDEVMFGPFVKMVSSNHTMKNNSFRFGPGVGSKIIIGRGTWIASNVIITAGVTIGEGSLVAAGAVVTKKFGSFSIIGGIPAKLIGSSND